MVLLPPLVGFGATATLYWGLVGLLVTLVAVPLLRRADDRDAGEFDWFGVPALAVWLVATAATSGGVPADPELFTFSALGLPVVVLALDALIRGRTTL